MRAQTKGVSRTIILGPKPTLSNSWRRKALRFSALRLLSPRRVARAIESVTLEPLSCRAISSKLRSDGDAYAVQDAGVQPIGGGDCQTIPKEAPPL